jgi:Tol biopolymer transport system component
VWLTVLGFAMASGATAYAAFPGTNGQIAYTSFSPTQVRTIFPDGTGDRAIATGSGPAWSPDGNHIAYHDGTQMVIANPDGSNPQGVAAGGSPNWSPDGTKLVHARSGDIFVTDIATATETNLTNSTNSEQNPAWSPDGTKIAFARDVFAFGTDGDIWLMDPDGSNQTNITDAGSGSLDDSEPNWSPDGSRIVFTRGLQGQTDEIYTMNPDGSGAAQLTANSVTDGGPAWSPDGAKIAFVRFTNPDHRVFVMNADGSAPVAVTPSGDDTAGPDWQPVLFPGYARPKSASPLRVSLVPTYNFCFSPNETHGPPLAFGSCNPPTQRSLTLTVGTPDANGAAANSTGFARLATLPGDPDTSADEADVKITADITDVRCAAANVACPGGATSDFAGQVLLTANLRLTDRLNGSPPQATMQDFPLRAPFACAATPDPDIGSTCSLSTTMDSVIPAAVPEGMRTIWQAGEVQVWDPGPNGTGYASCPPTCGNGDETIFMRQGIFVP